ncbi:hypothetical protein AB1Y20_003141 [Prymnesium parvum]|uniref:Uncharacterized protein n=1 Tax=Prymnesium parvum TaxID=97485 RepID=A0AB34JAL1_PRYPA
MSVAVCFSGWVRKSIPAAGAHARRHLVDPLAADAFLAATFSPGECGDDPTGGCVLPRVRRLRPFAAVDLQPMLSLAQLQQMVSRSPNFPLARAAYATLRADDNFNGLNWFAPVLGHSRASVLRELHDYSRSYAQVAAHERARGREYEWWVFSRLEMVWLAPHPPLSLLDARMVWVPPRSFIGVNDRHAAVPRRHAGVYFQRWELLMSAELLDVLPLQAILRNDPEHMLESLFVARGVAVGAFPIAAYLACCAPSDQCWRADCPQVALGAAAPCQRLLGAGLDGANESGGGVGLSDASVGCVAAGKSAGELREAVRNWRWTQCSGAQLVAVTPSQPQLQRPTADWVLHFERARNPQPHWAPSWSLWQSKVVLSVPLDHESPRIRSSEASLLCSVGGAPTAWDLVPGLARFTHPRPGLAHDSMGPRGCCDRVRLANHRKATAPDTAQSQPMAIRESVKEGRVVTAHGAKDSHHIPSTASMTVLWLAGGIAVRADTCPIQR